MTKTVSWLVVVLNVMSSGAFAAEKVEMTRGGLEGPSVTITNEQGAERKELPVSASEEVFRILRDGGAAMWGQDGAISYQGRFVSAYSFPRARKLEHGAVFKLADLSEAEVRGKDGSVRLLLKGRTAEELLRMFMNRKWDEAPCEKVGEQAQCHGRFVHCFGEEEGSPLHCEIELQ